MLYKRAKKVNKIVYLGNFSQTFCTETHISKTLEEMGYEVERIQENETTVQTVVARANLADMFLWTRTPGHFQGDTWKMLAGIKVPTASYHLDLYCGISREPTLDTDAFFHTDYLFQPDGDPESMRKFKRAGCNTYWFPPAVYGTECEIKNVKKDLIGDIAFIGSYEVYHEEWTYRRKLIDWLIGTYGERFTRYPNEKFPSMFDKLLNLLMSSTKIIIADTLCMNFTHQNYWSNRIPEETGRGGFVIAPRIKGLETCYEDGVHLVMYDYDNFGQLKGLIDEYLLNDRKREMIKMQGFRHTKKYHTFTSRMKRMFKIMGLR